MPAIYLQVPPLSQCTSFSFIDVGSVFIANLFPYLFLCVTASRLSIDSRAHKCATNSRSGPCIGSHTHKRAAESRSRSSIDSHALKRATDSRSRSGIDSRAHKRAAESKSRLSIDLRAHKRAAESRSRSSIDSRAHKRAAESTSLASIATTYWTGLMPRLYLDLLAYAYSGALVGVSLCDAVASIATTSYWTGLMPCICLDLLACAYAGALVGVSLCDAEASIAAPMTSRISHVGVMISVVAEGRCSMITSLIIFKCAAVDDTIFAML
eukprot:1159437-Pelagomonas_calceolata.AAC.7